MRKIFCILLCSMFAYAAIREQIGFRGSLGLTQTSSFLDGFSGEKIDPTSTGISYSIGISNRMASGFVFELDFLSSVNNYNDAVLNTACNISGNCVFVACTTNTSVNPPVTTCTSQNMWSPLGLDSNSVPVVSIGAVQTSTTTVGDTVVSDYLGTSSSVSQFVSGSLSVSSIMGNLIYQFSPATKLNPYVGLGLGLGAVSSASHMSTTPMETSITEITVYSPPSAAGNSVQFIKNFIGQAVTQDFSYSKTSFAHQLVVGSEIRFDVNNTLDFRLIKRFIDIPNTVIISGNGTPLPSIGIQTVENGVVKNKIDYINAQTLTFQVGLLYYS